MAKPNRTDKNAQRGEQKDMPELPDNHTDEMAGAEGIDDLAMEAGRQQGRESLDNAESFSGQGNQREGSPDPEGTGYTGNDNDTSGSDRGMPERNVVDRTSEDRDRNNPASAGRSRKQ